MSGGQSQATLSVSLEALEQGRRCAPVANGVQCRVHREEENPREDSREESTKRRFRASLFNAIAQGSVSITYVVVCVCVLIFLFVFVYM